MAGELQEWKDCPKDANGHPQIPSHYENHSKTSTLMLEMTKPIHTTGRVVTLFNRFCVTVGILALHDSGAFGRL